MYTVTVVNLGERVLNEGSLIRNANDRKTLIIMIDENSHRQECPWLSKDILCNMDRLYFEAVQFRKQSP